MGSLQVPPGKLASEKSWGMFSRLFVRITKFEADHLEECETNASLMIEINNQTYV